MPPRIYAADAALNRRITLDADKSRHLTRVLRKKIGDAVHLFNGAGAAYTAIIRAAAPAATELEVTAPLPPLSPPLPARVHIGQCICRPAKMDWLVEKSVELGMTTLTLLPSEKSDVRAPTPAMLQRWRRIIIAACEQCGQNTLPTITVADSISAWAATLPPSPPAQTADYENESQPPRCHRLLLSPRAQRPILPLPRSAVEYAIAVGAESGFTPAEETALTQHHHFTPVLIHPHTLRAETAAPAALTLLQSPLPAIF